MRLRSLRARIAVFFSLLLVAVLAVVFALVTTASNQIAREQNGQELSVGERVIARLLAQDRERLVQAASVLAADFAFRRAVATRDVETVLSALDNHGRRIGADVMMLTGLDGELVAANLERELAGQRPAIDALVREARSRGSAAAVLAIGREAYQMVVVPVRAPAPVGWVILGFLVDDQAALDLRAVTALHVTFLGRADDRGWSALASTRTVPERLEIAAALDPRAPAGLESLSVVDWRESRVLRLGGAGPESIVVVLERPIEEALARFDPMRRTLLGLSLVSVVLAAVGSVLLALQITRPINVLARLADRIQRGDYTPITETFTADEIGACAATFDHMRDAISHRESEIRRLAYEDGLTGLPNRAMFNDRLSQLAAIAKREDSEFTVLVMDLDRFKYVNDTLGHEAGDGVLRVVAERLQATLRDSDTVARLGGDEFAILLSTGSPRHLRTVLQRIQHVMDEPIVVDGQPVDVGCSIGVAAFPAHGSRAGTLLQRADIAMYVAKRTRAGTTVYDPEFDESRQEHLNLLGELRRAVDRDELELWYQPKVALASRRLVAVEALVRWRHPERGLVPPGSFIPFAEQTGAIRFVTRWAIERAARQCGEWLAAGAGSLRLSVNVSARDLLDREFPDTVSGSLARHAVPAHMVCLEIVESALMEDPERARSTMQHLRESGLEFSIDDFGTGYSSLAYVKDLPVNELKIDRSFVTHMTERREDLAIIRSTVELGHNLGLRVVAEGVETDEQLGLLRELGCDEAQGYLVARPMPLEDLWRWMQESAWGPAAGEGAALAPDGSVVRPARAAHDASHRVTRAPVVR